MRIRTNNLVRCTIQTKHVGILERYIHNALLARAPSDISGESDDAELIRVINMHRCLMKVRIRH